MKSFIPFRFVRVVLAFGLTGPALHADWKDEIGFTRLTALAAAELPTAAGTGLTQVEALEAEANYSPNTALALFSAITFSLKSGTSGVSNHATHVATNFYASTSLLPGNAAVDLYSADDWLDSGFLNLSTNSVPASEIRAVQNHSWIGTTETSDASATEANQRLDYAIHHQGFVCVVGENNGSSSTLPQLLGQGYHTISVGRDDGQHSAGFTNMDVTGRIKPDVSIRRMVSLLAT